MLLHGNAELSRGVLEFGGNVDFVVNLFILAAVVMNKSGKLLTISTVAAMLLGAASAFLITPQMMAVGRQLDFRVVFRCRRRSRSLRLWSGCTTA